MAYAIARTPGGVYAELAVPPSRRILAAPAAPQSFDPQLEGFFDVLAAPFKLGAKVVTTAAKGVYQVGKFAVTKAPTAAAGFVAGGPVGAAAAVGASIARDIARRGGAAGEAGAYETEYPIEVGYGDNTIPPYYSGAQGYGWPATAPGLVAPTQAQQAPAVIVQPSGTEQLLKWAPLALGAILLLRK